MCIRDSLLTALERGHIIAFWNQVLHREVSPHLLHFSLSSVCLLYTSDAADERSSVDLGGRRIIKKKTSKVSIGSADITKQQIKHNTYPLINQTLDKKKRET